MKKLFSPKQKATVALEALKGIKTINQVSSLYDAHPTQVGLWKKHLTDNAEQLFANKRKKENRTKDELIEQLYKVVGQRDIELEWLKKNWDSTHHERLACLDQKHTDISVARQADLLGISRASVYVDPPPNIRTLDRMVE